MHTTCTPLQATSPLKALALQLGIALLQLPAGHRCRCRALELPPPIEGCTVHSAQCTVHSAQGSPLQSHCTARAPYRILQGCTGSLIGGCCNSCAALIAGCRCRAGGGRSKHLQPCIRTESRAAALELRWQLQWGSRALDRTRRRRVVAVRAGFCLKYFYVACF